jgi:hemoglobin
VRTLPVTAAESAGGAGALRPVRRDPARPDLTEADLPALLAAFYDAAEREPLLAGYFAPLDMAAHLPVIADFWATILFHAGRYQRNAFRPHLALQGLGAPHFARWLAVLDATVDARHAGPAAEAMKAAGRRIAGAMQGRLGIAPAPDAARVRTTEG